MREIEYRFIDNEEMPICGGKVFCVTNYSGEYLTVVKNVYQSPAPASYLGSFAPWILAHASQPGYARDLVTANFRAFCERCLLQYDIARWDVGVVGGFGSAARDIFLPVAQSYGIRISAFYEDIIDLLLEYHHER